MAARVLHQLTAPPDAVERGGDEILRVFVVDGGLSVSLQRAFDQASTWGILLVDLARHAARIYARETELTEQAALDEIRRFFDAEWSRPTDPGSTHSVN